MTDKSPDSALLFPASTGESSSTTSAAPVELRWNAFREARPYVTVSGFALDSSGNFLLLHRSDKVRSAKNCWSLPSGLHEVGLSMEEQFAAELREELGLTPLTDRCLHLGYYENIMPNETATGGWHWVIHVMAMRVVTLEGFLNREPDKHDKVEEVSMFRDFIHGREWAPKLQEFLLQNDTWIRNQMGMIL